MLTIALPKGRLADQTLDIMEKAGYQDSPAFFLIIRQFDTY